MIALMLEGSAPGRDTWNRADLAELQNQAVFGSALAIAAIGVVVFYVATFGLTAVDFSLFGLAADLLILAGCIGVLVRWWTRLAAFLTVGGLLAVIAVNLSSPLGTVLLPWLALVVFLAVIVLGWRAAIGVSLAATLLILPPLHPIASPTRMEAAWSAIFFIWASLGFSWLLVRPTRVALAWAWESYCRAQEQMHTARERQAALARLSKTLSESYYQLEQLNLELEQARRQAQEARHLKAQFAAAVSHELRTPLNVVIGFCEMMVLAPTTAYGERLPANYQDDLETIYRNACHISGLVDDILDLSQIDADRMALHKEWVAVDHVVDEAVATVGGLFRDRRLYLDTIVGDDLPQILADRTRIRQIVINLLSNAARFTDHGGVTIRVDPAAAGVVVSVHDTGSGIPPDQLPYVFQEFFQVPGGSSRRGGSGLGLTVSNRFAELHGGTMEVTSELGHGSTFFLRLPVSKDGTPAPAAGTSWETRLRTRVRGTPEPKVLVVDGSGQLQRLFARYLDGYQIVPAPALPSPQHLSRNAPLRAIILGSVHGRGECVRLLQQLPQPHDVSVILCPLQSGEPSAEGLGVADYLVKPVTRDQFRLALRRLRSPVHSALVVDDDAEMALLLARMLRSIVRDCRVTVATQGDDALAQLRTHPPDVVFLDLLMSGVSGYDVIASMRADPVLAPIPIVVVSAQDVPGESLVAQELTLARVNGIPFREALRWIKEGLDRPLTESSVREPLGEPPG